MLTSGTACHHSRLGSRACAHTQGGCGACTVLLRRAPSAGWVAINACLRPLCSVSGQEVVTAEGLGGGSRALHPAQAALADGCGSQCGFCSPGMVASFVALADARARKSRGGASANDVSANAAAEVEMAISGNICRCTGYRPIVDAFVGQLEGRGSGTAACAVSPLGDIEDACAAAANCARAHARAADGATGTAAEKSSVAVAAGTARGSAPFSCAGWTAASSLADALAALRSTPNAEVVAGNTARRGVEKYYIPGGAPPPEPPLLVDVQAVTEMRGVCMTAGASAGPGSGARSGARTLRVGAAATLEEVREALVANAVESPSLFGEAAAMLLRVATPQVRSVGTVGGSVAFARAHAAFPSDVALLLIAARATVRAADVASGAVFTLSVEEYLAGDDAGKRLLLVSFDLPVESEGTSVVLQKVAKRSHNAHSLASLALRLEPGTAPLVAVGGVSNVEVAGAAIVRCARAEAALSGSSLGNESTLLAFLAALQSDLSAAGGSQARLALASGVAYRAYLRTLPEASLPPRLATAARPPEREPGRGAVEWTGATDPAAAPVGLPMPKLTARLQTSGRAIYGCDEPMAAGGLFGALVLSPVASADLTGVDASVALAAEGVVAFFDADAIGKMGYANTVGGSEPLFAAKNLCYAGQPVGIIVATSYEAARAAAAATVVTYTNDRPPVLTFDDAAAAKSYFDLPEAERSASVGDTAAALAAADVVVEGVAEIGGQAHFYMEQQNATASPTEGGGIELVCSTQSANQTSSVVATALQKSPAQVRTSVRRVGGAYGGKITRNNAVACAAAVAADTLGRAVRVEMELRDNMAALGSRRPHRMEYKLGLTKGGVLQAVEMKVTMLQGAFSDSTDGTPLDVLLSYDAAYRCPNWKFDGQVARTNCPANTYARAPGYLPGMLLLENALDHAARELGLAPEALRAANWYKAGDVSPRGQTMPTCTIDRCWALLLDKIGGLQARRAAVRDFNASSKWVKRGLAAVPMRYTIAWQGAVRVALVRIESDGKVVVEHSGIECGQGINTVAAQVAALELGIHVDDVLVAPTTTDGAAVPGAAGTGGSITTEQCGEVVKMASSTLAKRLAPYVAAQPNFARAVEAAFADGVDMQARARFRPGKSALGPNQYASYGAAYLEVELDVLSGVARPLDAECVIDCGNALNPDIAGGQVQGGFVMALGYIFGGEDISFDAASGANASAGTWEYKPPLALDTPERFNVTLLPHAPCATGFLRSKAVGEPPLLLGGCAMLALKDAVAAARAEVGADTKGFALRAPAPPEALQAACAADYGDYTLS